MNKEQTHEIPIKFSPKIPRRLRGRPRPDYRTCFATMNKTNTRLTQTLERRYRGRVVSGTAERNARSGTLY